ncbi:MAG: hypothetical protein AB2417_19635 [Clostridiaceae bacterium]
MVKRKKVMALILTISLVSKFMYVNLGVISNNNVKDNGIEIQLGVEDDNIILYYDPHPRD